MEKYVLIIGGSKGIGQATAEKFLKSGWKVGISYNSTNPQWLSAYPKEQYFSAPLDVRSEEAIHEFWKKYKEEFSKKLDVFVYNAGITIDNLTLHTKTEEYDQVMNVNLKGAWLFLREIGGYMYFKKAGKQFYVSSVSAKKGGRGQLSYSASKAGLEALVRVGAQEFSRANVLINAIAPGVIETDMSKAVLDYVNENKKSDALFDRITMRRVGQPEEIANFIYALSQDEITYITGQTFHVDGGYML